MAPDTSDREPRALLLARSLLALDGLAWLGLAGLALADHMLQHQFDCYAGCGLGAVNSPATGFRGAINDPAVVACLLVAILQGMLAWRLASPRRGLTLGAAGFQVAAALGICVATLTHIRIGLAIEFSLLAGGPALGVAGLLLTPPVRRLWKVDHAPV